MQSRFHDVAEAGSRLSYEGNEQDIPFALYEDFVRSNDIQSDDPTMDQYPDNVVLDLSTVLSGYLNHDWSAELEVGDDRVYDTLEEVFGSDLAYHWETSDEDFIHGTFHDDVGPREIFRSIAELSEEAEVYYPDHAIDAVTAARDNMISDLRDGGFESFDEFKTKKDDINKYSSQLVSALRDEANVLHAMRDAGMYEEASTSYDGNSFRTLNFTEDDAIEDAARELDGRTAIATFDQDFLESDLTALPPHLLAQMWG